MKLLQIGKVRQLFLLIIIIFFISLSSGCNQSNPENEEIEAVSELATRTAEDGKNLIILIGKNEEIGVEEPIFFYDDGSVEFQNGESMNLPYEQIDDLNSRIEFYSRDLFTAQENGLILNDDCVNCSEIGYFNPLQEKFVVLNVGNEISVSNLATPELVEDIQISVRYLQNKLKDFLKILQKEESSPELVIESEFFMDEGDKFNMSIYSDGRVEMADGRELLIPVDQVEMLKDNLNYSVFLDSMYGPSRLLYDDVTDCSDCFRITFYNYGKNGLLTIQGYPFLEDGVPRGTESNIMYEFDHLYYYYLQDDDVDK